MVSLLEDKQYRHQNDVNDREYDCHWFLKYEVFQMKYLVFQLKKFSIEKTSISNQKISKVRLFTYWL